MKPNQFAKRPVVANSRAAFYLKARENCPQSPTPAVAAWAAAAKMKERAARAESEWKEAHDSLSAYWQGLGMEEPRRYSLEGQELARLRKEERAKAAANFRAQASGCRPFGPYGGHWMEEPDQYFSQWPESMFRDVTAAEDVGHSFPGGFYDNPHGESFTDGTGLVVPLVAQLPGKDGRARYLAGFRHGGPGATFQTGRIYEAHGEDAQAARHEAARAACNMAERVAEEEREYQTAAEAGRVWAELKEEESTLRESLLAVLAERRAARGLGDFPAMCDALRATVADKWAMIQGNRRKREELAAGDSAGLIFYPDKAARAAFCDGAELAEFPA